MIETCCNCGTQIETMKKLHYIDLHGAYEHDLVMKWGCCPKCGLIVTQNPFSGKQLTDRYENFSKFEYNDSQVKTISTNDAFIKVSQKRKYFIDYYIKNKYNSVFEIGAASGDNIAIYKEDNKKVYAVEPSKNNCKIAEAKYGIRMFNGMYDEYEKENIRGYYDLVYMSHVLEHIVNPYGFLKSLTKLNNKYFFIEVPQLDIKFINEPFGMMCEEHVNLFTFNSLQNIMYNIGFNLVGAEIVFSYDDHLPAGSPALSTLWEKSENPVKKRPTVSSKNIFKNYIEMNDIRLDEIKQKIKKIPKEEKLAVWGIGHHASMLLGETSLSQKNIVKAYDSDERKYNYKFNDIFIESFKEKDIMEGEVSGVLVTTYTAQASIEKILNKYKDKCHIYTLY